MYQTAEFQKSIKFLLQNSCGVFNFDPDYKRLAFKNPAKKEKLFLKHITFIYGDHAY